MDINKLTGKQVRGATVDSSKVDVTSRTVEMYISSEALVERFGQYYERLCHDADCVDLSFMNNGAPVLEDHDTCELIGVVEGCELDAAARKLKAVLRFSKSEDGDEVFQDIVDGIRRNVSIGYEVTDIRNSGELMNGLPIYEVTGWKPLEASVVSIPADETVGVGRTKDLDSEAQVKKLNDRLDAFEIRVSEERKVVTMEDKTPEVVERERVTEIMELGKRFKFDVTNYVAEGAPVGVVHRAINDKFEAERANAVPASNLGLGEQEKKQYSLLRAIQAQIPDMRVDATYERECSEEIAKRVGKAPSKGGLYIPDDIQKRVAAAVTSTTIGSGLVNTDFRPQNFIDYLYNASIVDKLGVTRLSGLVGNVQIPKLSTGNDVGWITEGSDATLGDATFVQVTMSPKTVAGYSEFTRNMILLGLPGIENLISQNLGSKIGVAVSKAFLQGTNANGQPKGIINQTGVGSVSGTSYNYASLLEHQTDLELANVDMSNAKYLIDPTTKNLMKAKSIGGTMNGFLVSPDNVAGGLPVIGTNHMPTSSVLLGNFSEAILGEWGLLEIFVNPYILSNGGIRVYGFYSVDVAVQHAAAFAYASSVSLA